MDKFHVAVLPVLLTTCGCLMVLYYTVSFWTGIITGFILVWFCLLIISATKDDGIILIYNWRKCTQYGIANAICIVICCALSCYIIGKIRDALSTIEGTNGENCNYYWMSPNLEELSSLLKENVFGQHIAVSTIVKLLKGHLKTGSTKPLVLSLHGPSGTGKSYVTQLIIEDLRGKNRQFVHFISPMTDIPITQDIDSYKVALKVNIEKSVKRCPNSMFVFDMVEYMPAGVLDVLQPFLDHNKEVNGVDYRKAIFIFISKTGNFDVIHGVTKNMIVGSQRMQLSLKDFEQKMKILAYESPNGLYKSNLISSNLVSAFVPFLPLERTHVKQCIAQELIKKDIYMFDHQVDAEEVDIIADQLHYTSDGGFSESGCKGVIEKINIVSRDE